MKILICGGDERSVLLAGMLKNDGHEVLCFCLDRAQLPDGVRAVSSPEQADAVILPVPAEDAHGLLNAPLGSQPCRIEHILDCADCGAVIIGGKISAQIKASAAERGQRCFDYMKCPNFTVKNAAITAEGAVSELMRRARSALCDMRILVVGWGRIGKLLINKLSALCPSVYLMSVNTESRALAAELGCCALPPDCPREIMQSFDAVINTAPAQVIPDLTAFRDSCILLELASAPGGIDPAEAADAGLDLTVLRALPGRYAPKSASEAMYSAISDILKGV